MGFGILIIGYFIAFALSVSNFYFFADIIGGLVMGYAIIKLKKYNYRMLYCLVADIAFCVISLGSFLISYFNISIMVFPMNLFRTVLILVFHYFLLNGIKEISVKAENSELEFKCKRNFIIIFVYYLIYIIYSIVDITFSLNFSQSNAIFYILGFVCIWFNVILFHSAYVYLADPTQKL